MVPRNAKEKTMRYSNKWDDRARNTRKKVVRLGWIGARADRECKLAYQKDILDWRIGGKRTCDWRKGKGVNYERNRKRPPFRSKWKDNWHCVVWRTISKLDIQENQGNKFEQTFQGLHEFPATSEQLWKIAFIEIFDLGSQFYRLKFGENKTGL